MARNQIYCAVHSKEANKQRANKYAKRQAALRKAARYSPVLVNNCPIRTVAGRCLQYIWPRWKCPVHGDVAEARKRYMETGVLQELS